MSHCLNIACITYSFITRAVAKGKVAAAKGEVAAAKGGVAAAKGKGMLLVN